MSVGPPGPPVSGGVSECMRACVRTYVCRYVCVCVCVCVCVYVCDPTVKLEVVSLQYLLIGLYLFPYWPA